MYKLPDFGSVIGMPSRSPYVAPEDPKDIYKSGNNDPDDPGIAPFTGPLTKNRGVLPGQFGTVPDFGSTPAVSTGGPYGPGREDGVSVADIFRMGGQPYNSQNIDDLTKYQMGTRSPSNPGGDPSVLHSRHYVDPQTENMRNKFFYKPYEEMNPREQTNYNAYKPRINKATHGMTQNEARAYRKATYGYDNSAYFKTRAPTTKDYFGDNANV